MISITRLYRAALAALLGTALAALLPALALAAGSDGVVSVADSSLLDSITAAIGSFIVGQASAHPWVVTTLTVIGVFRLVFKPIMTAIEAYVKSTPSTSDDARLAAIEASRAYKLFCWLLDLLGSIKIGTQAAASSTSPASSTSASGSTPTS